MNIRPAKREDCARMLELVHELAVFEKAAPGDVTITLSHFTESGFGPHPVWWGIVAEDAGGAVVGFANYYIRFSTWKGQRLYLEDLIVTESHRGKGIGKLLLEAILDTAKQKGYSGVVWQVLVWNERAIRFYERYGAKFDREWVNVYIDFDQVSSPDP